MSVFDVRNSETSEIKELVFADNVSKDKGITHAFKMQRFAGHEAIMVFDEEFDPGACDVGFVVISSKQHATDLIKAINKAIDLGWLK